MINLIYKLWLLWVSPRLGSDVFYPLPEWLKSYMSRYPLYKRVQYYSRLLNGVDMSFIAPNNLACCESMTRLLRNLNPNLTPMFTYTPDFRDHMKSSKHYIQLDERLATLIGGGVIVIAPTKQGVFTGHVGVLDKGRIWSNSSENGRWSNKFSLLTFKNYYHKLDIEYYLPV